MSSPLRQLLNVARRANLAEEGRPEPETIRFHPWTRRSFLKATVAGSAAFALPSVGHAYGGRRRFDHEVAIIGAGICGMNAARIFEKAGVRAHVYEGSRRLGGRIFTREVREGVNLELGATFINKDHADMLETASDLGLELFDREVDLASDPVTPPTAYFFEGTTFSEGEIARRLRPVARRIGRDAAALDEDFDAVAARLDPLSVTEYLNIFDQSEQGPLDPVARALLESSIRTEYGVEPEASSSLQLLFNLPVVDGREVEVLSLSDETFTIRGGNGLLIERIAERIGRRNITTGAILERIDEFPQGGYRLRFRNGRRVTTKFVIVTIPFTVLKRVRLNLCDPAPNLFFRAVDSYQLGRNEKVFVEFEDRVWQGRDGWRSEAWSDRVAATWEATRTQPNSATAGLTLFLSGDQANRLLREKKKDVARDLVEYLEGLTPGLQNAATGAVVATKWQKNPFSLGAYTSFPPGFFSDGPFLSWVEGDTPEDSTELRRRGFVIAGEHVSDAFYGFMNGGAETGRLAAMSVLNVLQRLNGTR